MRYLSVLSFLIFILTFQDAFTQSPCVTFNSVQHSQVNITPSVTFGTSQLNFNGTVFNPTARLVKASSNTCPASPLLILIHGGGFTAGTPNMMDSLAFKFAKMGYVCASINYRLGWQGGNCPTDSSEAIRAWFRAVQDIKGAIRYFKGNATVFGIDTNNVFLAGWSAGGYAAIGAAYSDLESETPPFCSDLGSIEGDLNVGNHSSNVKAVSTFSAAFLFPSHTNAGRNPGIIMFNNSFDAYDIPISCGKWWNFGTCENSYPQACGIETMLPLFQQNNIAAANIIYEYQTTNEFNSHWLHNPNYFPFWNEETDSMANFFQQFITVDIPLIINPINSENQKNYLVPAFSEYQLPNLLNGNLYSINGQLIATVLQGKIYSQLPGIYILKTKSTINKIIVY